LVIFQISGSRFVVVDLFLSLPLFLNPRKKISHLQNVVPVFDLDLRALAVAVDGDPVFLLVEGGGRKKEDKIQSSSLNDESDVAVVEFLRSNFRSSRIQFEIDI